MSHFEQHEMAKWDNEGERERIAELASRKNWQPHPGYASRDEELDDRSHVQRDQAEELRKVEEAHEAGFRRDADDEHRAYERSVLADEDHDHNRKR